jgi:hypothetical protein
MKILLLLLLVVSCECKKLPQFAYQQKVEIISGFYKGHKGIVQNKGFHSYYIKIDNKDGEVDIDSECLKADSGF